MGNDRLAAHVGLAQRGYQYVKAYGMGKLYRKAREHFGRNALERGYQEWMILNRPSESEKELQREHHFVQEPLISIVVPIYRTPEVFLREMIESVLNQTYGKLELCLADGSGEDDTAGTVICEYVEKDPRVRYQKLGSNLGIAGNTNAAVNCDLLDQLFVIEGDSQLVCYHFSYCSSTASKLTANCDNTFTHRNTSISFVYYIIFFPTL